MALVFAGDRVVKEKRGSNLETDLWVMPRCKVSMSNKIKLVVTHLDSVSSSSFGLKFPCGVLMHLQACVNKLGFLYLLRLLSRGANLSTLIGSVYIFIVL